MFALASHALLAWMTLVAPPAPSPRNHVQVRLLVGPTVGDSTSDRWMGLELRVTPGWHVYWRNPGDAGSPPVASWRLPLGWAFGPLQFPLPRRIEVPPLTAFGYTDRVVYPFRLRIGPGANQSAGRVAARVSWVVCEVACIAEEDSLHGSVTPNDGSAADRELVALAVAQLPQPLPNGWRTAARDAGRRAALVVRGIASSAGRPADFLPAVPGVLEHSAKIDVIAERDSLVLQLTRSPYATAFPDTLEGLLIIGDAASTAAQSFDVRVPVEHGTRVVIAQPSSTAAPLTLLAVALLSGVLVNLMPCVFPLLAVKALSFVTGTTTVRDRTLRAAAYAGGSMLSCVALGALLLVGRARDATAWGFQMQSPSFLGVIALVAFVAALNLLGVFEVPSLLPSAVVSRVNQLRSHAGAFAAGAIAILVGAPCTAPFFGATLAAALTGPPMLALTTLGVFGAGAAIPVAAVTLAPTLRHRLPKPGPWMQTTRQLLAFPMLATVAWLVWVATVQTGPAAIGALLGALCAVGFGAWMLGRWWTVSAPRRVRRSALGVSVGIAAIAIGRVGALEPAKTRDVSTTMTAGLRWQAYTDARLDSLRAAGRTVRVDFTAAWCLTCKVNEIGALSSPRVAAAVREDSVALLRADLTVGDTSLTRALHAIGAASVPTYAVYRPDGGAPSLLPPLLTVGVVTEALDRARGRAPREVVTSTQPDP